MFVHVVCCQHILYTCSPHSRIATCSQRVVKCFVHLTLFVTHDPQPVKRAINLNNEIASRMRSVQMHMCVAAFGCRMEYIGSVVLNHHVSP